MFRKKHNERIFNNSISISGEIYLTLNGQDITKLTGSVKVIEGENVLFECTSSHPNTTFIWTKGGTASSFSHTYEIHQIQVQDEAEYKCQGTVLDDATGYAKLTEYKQVFVEVMYQPTYPSVEPYDTDDYYRALKGDYITLMCKSDGKPEPHYQWRYKSINGAVLTRNSTYHLTVDSYIIDYYCIVQNRMVPTVGEPKTNTLTRKLQIKVYVKAVIYKIEEGIYRNVNEDDPVAATCIAYGIPFPKIWWTKDGDDNFYLENDKLSQTGTSYNFTGKYYCNAENVVTATNQTPIRTHAKQEVHVTVHKKRTDITRTEQTTVNNCKNENIDTNGDQNNDSENTVLFILTGTGWLGFVMSGLFHIIMCTKNRNKDAEKCNIEKPLSAPSVYISDVRIQESTDSEAYDKITGDSFSDGSSASLNSNVTKISTVPSYASIQTISKNYIHAVNQ